MTQSPAAWGHCAVILFPTGQAHGEVGWVIWEQTGQVMAGGQSPLMPSSPPPSVYSHQCLPAFRAHLFLPEPTFLHIPGWLFMALYGQDQAGLGVTPKFVLLDHFYWTQVRSRDVTGGSGMFSRFYHPPIYLPVLAAHEY